MAGENLTKTQGVNMAASAITSAANAYGQYNTAKYEANMTDLNWRTNKAIATEHLKVNQYILGRNRLELLSASADEALQIQTTELEARAEADVVHATYGMIGGSAMQVLHSISRSAEHAESKRLVILDNALFSNKMSVFQSESGAMQQIGIRPVGGVSGTLAIGSAVAEFGAKMSAISRPIKET